MRASKVKTVRSLERGLDTLRALQRVRSASLHELHVITELPKATLTRVLLTLERSCLIWQRVGDGKYCPSYTLKDQARRISKSDRTVEIASPLLLELARKTRLKAHLALPRGDHMELCEASYPDAPGKDSRQSVGCEVNMLRSGLGLAYLAFCNEHQRQQTLKRLRASERAGNAIARNAAWITRVLDETQRRGYGIRYVDYGKDFDKPKRESNDGMAAIAVPVIVGDRAIGSINLLWGERMATHEVIARRYLQDMRITAARIAQGLCKQHVA